MASPALALDLLEDIIRIGQAARYMLLVGFTVLIYDHLLTIHHEIAYIWRSKFGLASAIFTINRYLVPCMLSIDIYEFFGLSGSRTVLFCKVWTIAQSYLSVASYMSIHALVALRVHALYGGLPWLRKTLLITGSIFLLSCIAITTMGNISITAQMAPIRYHCVNKIPAYAWTIWLPSLLFESCLFALTISVAFSQLKEGQGISRLYMILFRDGILYFVAVFLCTLFTLFMWAVAPRRFIPLARYFSLAMINVAGSRLVLNLKVFAAERDDCAGVDPPITNTSMLSPSAFRIPNSADHQSTLAGSDLDYERGEAIAKVQ